MSGRVVAPGTRRTSVLVNLTWLVPGVVGGSEQSTTNALRAVLADPSTDVDIRLAVLRPFLDAHPDLASALPCEVLELDGSDKMRRVIAEQSWLALVARRSGAQVVHHAGGVVPLVHPGRVVVTIHDLQPLDLAQNFSVLKRNYIRTMVGRSARSAEVVCVPSEFTRRRVVELLRVDPGRVHIVPWSVPAPPDAAAPAASGSSGTPARGDVVPYLLYPAITYAHKNHLMLLEAFALVAAATPEIRLVLTGGAGPLEGEVAAKVQSLGLSDRVERTGRVSDAELDDWFDSALAVVVPSTYEGFGLPVLEAMSRGLPVVAARAGALLEVARVEDLVAPDDVTAWASAMQAVVESSGSERAARVAAGRALAAAFTPQRTATALLDAYRRAAHGASATSEP